MAKRKSAGTTNGGSSSSSASRECKKKRKSVEKVEEISNGGTEVKEEVEMNGEGDVEEISNGGDDVDSSSVSDRKMSRKLVKKEEIGCRFVGDPVPADEAKLRWPHRYPDKVGSGRKRVKNPDDEDELILAKSHYLKAEVDGCKIFELNDDAHVQSEDGHDPYICKILEIFEGVDGLPYFRAQWYYRPVDTVIKDSLKLSEGKKRIFLSEIMDDNPLDCLLEKLRIVKVNLNLDIDAKKSAMPECDYYYDLKYLLPYSTFIAPPADTVVSQSESESTISSDADDGAATTGDTKPDTGEVNQGKQSEMTLLDLYSGCGAMSTGLCLGANLGGTNLVTRWAVDFNSYACESLALNHPETNVRNETVDDFLSLIKEWQKLCASFKLVNSENTHELIDSMTVDDDDGAEDDDEEDKNESDEEIFEVEKFIGICHGDPNQNAKPGLYFKVRWKGYGPNEDTWEPLDGLGNCRERMEEFVKRGYKEKLLPLPGDVDVVCGGPPCQGISGFNRFRNAENPLADPKNKQLLVYMDVVDFLKPRYVLMENVVDIVKFAKGFLGRYALGKLVDMNYQVRLGMMAAGAYGLPQFRMRVFVWGARPSEKLPQYPLPTHDLVLRGVIPNEFERNTVAYNEGHTVKLENKLLLGDAISDLPEVPNDESRDEIKYDRPPETEFQRFIRLTKEAMSGQTVGSELLETLYDHRPLQLNVDDHQRVCRVPKKKGANFRDFPGVRVRADNKVEFDPDIERERLPSGKPLVPDYAMTFVGGTSSKPFGRLWWDETVPTVVTRAEPHNQIVTHPVQDRVLTIRENARLQGFPDYYQLKGPIKQRYMQVGNAVAVPVARALGYAMAKASQGSISDEPLLVLPEKFPNMNDRAALPSVEDNNYIL
ncbi:unnamed protein product [Amaranthus hypochondriacus]